MNDLSLNFNIEFKDYLHYRFNKVYTNPIIAFLTTISIINVISFSLMFIFSRDQILITPMSYILPPILFVVVPFMIFVMSKQQYLSKRLNEKVEYLFHNNIEVNSKYNNENFSWDEVKKIIETKKIFILYISRSVSFIIPKLIFSSPENLLEFTRIIEENNIKKRNASIGKKFLIMFGFILLFLIFVGVVHFISTSN